MLGGPGEHVRHPLQTLPAQIYNQTELVGTKGTRASLDGLTACGGAPPCIVLRPLGLSIPSLGVDQFQALSTGAWQRPPLVGCAQACSLGHCQAVSRLCCADCRGAPGGTPLFGLVGQVPVPALQFQMLLVSWVALDSCPVEAWHHCRPDASLVAVPRGLGLRLSMAPVSMPFGLLVPPLPGGSWQSVVSHDRVRHCRWFSTPLHDHASDLPALWRFGSSFPCIARLSLRSNDGLQGHRLHPDDGYRSSEALVHCTSNHHSVGREAARATSDCVAAGLGDRSPCANTPDP